MSSENWDPRLTSNFRPLCIGHRDCVISQSSSYVPMKGGNISSVAPACTSVILCLNSMHQLYLWLVSGAALLQISSVPQSILNSLLLNSISILHGSLKRQTLTGSRKRKIIICNLVLCNPKYAIKYTHTNIHRWK